MLSVHVDCVVEQEEAPVKIQPNGLPVHAAFSVIVDPTVGFSDEAPIWQTGTAAKLQVTRKLPPPWSTIVKSWQLVSVNDSVAAPAWGRGANNSKAAQAARIERIFMRISL